MEYLIMVIKADSSGYGSENLTGDDNVIDENDKTVIGNAQPKFYGGLNNFFLLTKDLDLSIFLTFSLWYCY